MNDRTSDGRLTITGAFNKYENDLYDFFRIIKSKKEYPSKFKKILIFDNGKPAADYSAEDVEDIKNKILEKGRIKNPKFKTHNIYLLVRLIQFAKYDENKDTDKETKIFFLHKKKKSVKKRDALRSFSIKQIVRLFKEIYKNIEENGLWLGIALMFFLGLRDSEAAAVDFCDIIKAHDYKHLYLLIVYEVGGWDTPIRHGRGKTGNAVRLVPIPLYLLLIIKLRMQFIYKTTNINKDEIMDYPMSCRRNEYKTPCSARDISEFGASVLKKCVNLDENEYEGQKGDNSKKDIVTYCLRKNAVTFYKVLGLSEEQLTTIIGHDVISESSRNMLLGDNDFLYEIQQLINKPFIKNKEYSLDDKPLTIDNEAHATIVVKKGKKRKIHISIKNREFNDPITSALSGTYKSATIKEIPNKDKLAKDINISKYLVNGFKDVCVDCQLGDEKINEINTYFENLKLEIR